MTTPKPYPEADSASSTLPDKVSEAVAPYLTRAEFERGASCRQPAPRFIAGLPASEEVWNFAQEHTLAPYLETSIRIIREAFKNIDEIKLTYESDPDILDLHSIAIHFYVTGSMDELLQADRQSTRAFIAAIPSEAGDKINLILLANLTDGNMNGGT